LRKQGQFKLIEIPLSLYYIKVRVFLFCPEMREKEEIING
jgi:hypothetical protein